MKREELILVRVAPGGAPRCGVEGRDPIAGRVKIRWKTVAMEGESPVLWLGTRGVRCVSDESSCLGMQLQVGGKFHPKLNTGETSIVDK